MRRRRAAFTLVELLAVIAIVSILAAIIVPTTGKAITKARRAKAASHLRQIALAHATYTYDDSGSFRQINVNDLGQWAVILAEHTGLNDPQLWVVSDDPKVSASTATKPRVVATHTGDSWALASDFAAFPKSFAVASGVPANAPASTTPIAWTRGLKADGTWDAEKGVYGAQGGHIAFLDGHVQWFQNLSAQGGQLVNYQTGTPTANILEALPASARAWDDTGAAL